MATRHLAADPETPVEVLTALAQDKDEAVREGVAGNASTPVEALTALAKDKNNWVRRLVAGNVSTPVEVVMVLAKDKDGYVREGLARNAASILAAESMEAPPSTLQLLARLPKTDIRLAVTRNPNTPAETLRALASDKVKKVRESALAALDATGITEVWTWPVGVKTSEDRMRVLATLDDAAVLERLTDDSMVSTRVFAWMRTAELGVRPIAEVHRHLRAESGGGSTQAKNRWIEMRIAGLRGSASDALVDVMIGVDADGHAAGEIRSGTPFSEEQLLRMLAAKFKWTAWEVASTLPLTTGLLEALATAASTSEPIYSYDFWLREYAGHPGVVLSDEFVSRHPQVLVAMHPLTPAPVVAKLRKGRSKYVRAACLRRQDTSQEMLIAASDDQDAEIRAAVVANPNCPPGIVQRLSKDGEAQVRAAVGTNPSTQHSTLRELSLDDDVTVHAAIAGNPSCPIDLLECFVDNPNFTVQQALASNHSLPQAMLDKYLLHTDVTLRLVALGNPSTLGSALQSASTDPDPDIRGAVARNPNTPIAALMCLAVDSERYVRAAIRNNPNVTDEIKVLTIISG